MTDYCTLAEAKTHLRERGSTATVGDDTEISDKITVASRRVDKDTGRPHGFGLDDTATARIYTPTHPELLIVSDIATTTDLVVEVGYGSSYSTLDSSAYDFLPENAIADGRAIEMINRISGCWPIGQGYRVRVTAKWGWPAVPEEIKAATLIMTARLFKRKFSPQGIEGANDWQGVIRTSRVDYDYDALIADFVKPVV